MPWKRDRRAKSITFNVAGTNGSYQPRSRRTAWTKEKVDGLKKESKKKNRTVNKSDRTRKLTTATKKGGRVTKGGGDPDWIGGGEEILAQPGSRGRKHKQKKEASRATRRANRMCMTVGFKRDRGRESGRKTGGGAWRRKKARGEKFLRRGGGPGKSIENDSPGGGRPIYCSIVD